MAKARIRQRRIEGLKRSIWWTSGAAVLAALLLIVLSPRALPGVTIPELRDRPYAGEGKTLGPADAPVLVEEFADFQCPFCAQFARETLPQIEATYIATGQVRYVFNNFAFIGQESMQAAEAVECAAEQGRAWDYMDTLWANQRGENRGAFADPYLKAFAEGLGLDGPQFNGCLDTGRYRSQVDADTQAAHNRGVSSTPTLFVNGQHVEHGEQFAMLSQAIEAALAGGG